MAALIRLYRLKRILGVAGILFSQSITATTSETRRHYPYWIASKGEIQIALIGEIHTLPAESIILPTSLLSRIVGAKAIGIEATFDTARSNVFAWHPTKKISTIIGDDEFLRLVDLIRSKSDRYPVIRPYSVPSRLDGTHPWLAGLHLFSAIAAKSVDKSTLTSSEKYLPLAHSLLEMYGSTRANYSLDDKEAIGSIWEACESKSLTLQYLSSAILDGLNIAEETNSSVIRFSVEDLYSGWDHIVEKYNKRLQRNFFSIHDRCVVVPRTKRWIGKIVEQASKYKSIVYIVGIFHLIGREGLVELLIEEGFDLTLYQ